MILEFGGQKFELEANELKALFPLSYGDKRIVVSILMETLEDEEMLSHFSCGDIVNEVNQLMASADCDQSPTYKLTMEILIEVEGEEKVEAGACTAISCQEHSFIGMLQVLFMSGLITSYKIKPGEEE